MSTKQIGIMHIYGQPCWHDDAFIVGDTTSLKALRDAIDKALDSEHNEAAMSSFATDGEGYRTIILKRDLDDTGWNEIASPYTDEIAEERREDIKWPYQLCFDYLKLVRPEE